jgi:hypothetical protein
MFSFPGASVDHGIHILTFSLAELLTFCIFGLT